MGNQQLILILEERRFKFMKVQCPICGKKLDNLTSHMKRTHKLDKSEVLNKFPGIKLVSEEYHSSQSVKTTADLYKRYQNPEYKERNTKMIHEKMIPAITSEGRSKGKIEQWKNEEFRDKMSAIMRNAMLNSEKNKEHMQSDKMAFSREQGWNGRGHKSYYNGILLRSNYELDVAKLLDQYEINWQYEALRISYIDVNGFQKIYISDFYLPEFNMIVEVKCQYRLLNDANIENKKNACVKLGYNYKFVTEKELYNSDEFKSLLIEMSSETIESVK